jgi:hypothetical protein
MPTIRKVRYFSDSIPVTVASLRGSPQASGLLPETTDLRPRSLKSSQSDPQSGEIADPEPDRCDPDICPLPDASSSVSRSPAELAVPPAPFPRPKSPHLCRSEVNVPLKKSDPISRTTHPPPGQSTFSRPTRAHDAVMRMISHADRFCRKFCHRSPRRAPVSPHGAPTFWRPTSPGRTKLLPSNPISTHAHPHRQSADGTATRCKATKKFPP